MFRVEQWLSEVTEEPPQAASLGLLFDCSSSPEPKDTGSLESSLHYLQDSLDARCAIITDPWGNIAWMNDSAGSLLGISLDKDEGRPLVSKTAFLIFQTTWRLATTKRSTHSSSRDQTMSC